VPLFLWAGVVFRARNFALLIFEKNLNTFLSDKRKIAGKIRILPVLAGFFDFRSENSPANDRCDNGFDGHSLRCYAKQLPWGMII
jgi:hypothetical protein